MNNFFKPALSLLLELKLVDYPLDKRLLPLVTFLERHRLALAKYLYPATFIVTMELLWGCILQVSKLCWACLSRTTAHSLCPGPGGRGSVTTFQKETCDRPCTNATASALSESHPLDHTLIGIHSGVLFLPLQILLEFMHDRGKGLPLDMLTASSVSTVQLLHVVSPGYTNVLFCAGIPPRTVGYNDTLH